MKICATIAEARVACRESRNGQKSLALVPTMGALHEGHLSLVHAAKAQCGVVAVSIFVNPTQFSPTEDLAKYPRPFERDAALLKRENVDLLFAPPVEEMYAADEDTWVTGESLSEKLDGRFRPGHFRGVTTVVAKLFHIFDPDFAFFGQKDAAQLAVIRRMVRDLRFRVRVVGCPIVREADGLAMSSRNGYLSSDERQRALVLSRSLRKVEEEFRKGERSSQALAESGREVMAAEPLVQLEYLEIVDPDTLDPVPMIERPTLVAVAAHVGATRLIDNLVLDPRA